MKKLPLGQEDFKEIIENDYYYVDKTKYIEQVINGGITFLLFARPRRFGKSLFISTLDYFFNIENRKENKKLFKGLYIEKSNCFKEMGKYPVIYLNFKEIIETNYNNFYIAFVSTIRELYKNKEYVLSVLDNGEKRDFINIKDGLANEVDYKRSLKYLINWLERYHKKQVVVLIDEYDIPIHNAYVNGYYDEVINIMKVFLSTLKGNRKLKLAILTGVLRVSKESLLSGTNNLVVNTMMNKDFNTAFGFTTDETKELLEYYGLKLTKEVKEYYDGYNFSDTSIYNPWSIIYYANDGNLLPYWINTSGNVLIEDLISKMTEENKAKIFDLLEGKSESFDFDEKLTYIDFDEYNDIEKILNLLYASGYLTYDKKEDNINYFRIPNNEVKVSLSKIMQNIMFKDSILPEENTKFIENIISYEQKC